MRPDDNSFDDLLRDKLNNDEESVSPGLWNKIDAGIGRNNSRSKKGLLIYSALLLLLLLVSFGIWPILKVNNFTEVDNFSAAGNIDHENESVITHTSTFSGQSTETADNQAKSGFDYGIGSGSNTAIRGNKNSKTKSPALFVSLNIPHSNKDNTALNGLTPYNGIVEHIENIKDNNSEVLALEPEISAVTANTDGQMVSEIQEIPSNAELADIKDVKTELKDAVKSEKPSPEFGFEIFYSPDFIHKSMAVNYGTESYLQLRKSSEKVVFASSKGIEFFCKTGKNIEIKTGFIYSEIQEQLHYTFYSDASLPPSIRSNSISGIWVNPLTGFTSMNDTVVSNYLFPDDIVGSNKYYFYNIPLEINISHEIKSFVIGIELGAFMNFGFTQKGSIINTDLYSKINFDNEPLNPYRKSIGLGALLGIYAGYNINSHFRFFINPEFRYYLHKINKTNSPLNENLYSISATSGLRFEF